ncbi:hypothetical protein J2Z84_000097 [Agrobacterium rubi]|nr:hypothetical protein [Agrobacterium rubi]
MIGSEIDSAGSQFDSDNGCKTLILISISVSSVALVKVTME